MIESELFFHDINIAFAFYEVYVLKHPQIFRFSLLIAIHIKSNEVKIAQ